MCLRFLRTSYSRLKYLKLVSRFSHFFSSLPIQLIFFVRQMGSQKYEHSDKKTKHKNKYYDIFQFDIGILCTVSGLRGIRALGTSGERICIQLYMAFIL